MVAGAVGDGISRGDAVPLVVDGSVSVGDTKCCVMGGGEELISGLGLELQLTPKIIKTRAISAIALTIASEDGCVLPNDIPGKILN
jgi:hypothetical protein